MPKNEDFDQLYLLKTKSPLFQKTLEFCRKAAASDTNILLAGESGTGKEILSKHIHRLSSRRDRPFVAVNCSSYADTLLESELFGHEQGAFTGAVSCKKGKLELADRGTLLLDEVGDISIQIQVKLLRVIETKCVERIGSNEKKDIDFRLISATNVDLKNAIVRSTFREDFFYRVSTVVITIPPLRQRREDLPDLIHFFINQCSQKNGIVIRDMAPEVKEFLYSYDYPGNVRELKNIIERMVVFSSDGVFTVDGIPIMHSYYKTEGEKSASFGEFKEIIPFQAFKQEAEKAYLTWVLSQTGGNVAEAARRLDMSTRQFFNKIRDLQIKK